MDTRAAKHRRRKRKLEAQLSVDLLQKDWLKKSDLQILEFGAGACNQVDYLQKIGKVTAIDIYTHEDIAQKNINFIECSVTDTPFDDKTFDLIYSNHVIAHIGEQNNHELYAAFEELKRIGSRDCIYAFSVPTSLWLLLSVPSYYLLMAGKLLKLPFRKRNKHIKPIIDESSNEKTNVDESLNEKPLKGASIAKLLLPQGIGIYPTFGMAFKALKQKSWSTMFQSYDFQVLKSYPLAIYGDSNLPIIPITTSFNKFNITSSRLFILKKNNK